MADIEKEIVSAPELPNVIQGDGRYVMNQIKKYLKEMAIQVNLANGYTADEIAPSPSGLAAPANFVLQFDSTGGRFSWRHVTYLDKLAYYEIRTDESVGAEVGLLDRTIETESRILPVSSTGKVYLYAVLKDGTYSSASVLTYNKVRPEAPQDISMTRNEQGILITYTYIPLDCIGAHIYINGKMYETDDNLFLYTDSETVDSIQVAYYDSFGEGERGYLYLHIPTVSNFIVERNGAYIDLQWDPVDVFNVGYVVKAASVPVWESGVEIFRTTRTKNKLEYPNTGDIYFMIKAYDPHNVYSDDASWYLLTTVDDISRNHIIDFDQYETRYSGNKINMYYDDDAGGLRLTDGVFSGEYIFKGELPQTYRARNWHQEDISSVENSQLRVMDLDFSVTDYKAQYITCMGGLIGDTDSIQLRSQISRFVGGDETSLLIVNLDGDLLTSKDEPPESYQNADRFDYGRFGLGVVADDLTSLKYEFKNPSETFGFIFHIKVSEPLKRCVFARIKSTDGEIEIGYDGKFYASGSDGFRAETQNVEITPPDYLSIGVSQSDTERSIYVSSINVVPQRSRAFEETTYVGSVQATPIGVFTIIEF